MTKEIWVPDSTTHVITEPDGSIRVWDNIIMTKKNLDKKDFGFDNKEKEKE